jgi:hypothetical protein
LDIAGAWKINQTKFLSNASLTRSPLMEVTEQTTGVSLKVSRMGTVPKRVPLAMEAWLTTPQTAGNYQLKLTTFRADGATV